MVGPARNRDVNDMHRDGDLPDDPFAGAAVNDPFAGLVHAIPAKYLRETPPRRKYLLSRQGAGVIPLATVGFLIGSGGVGKTNAECGLALSVATGVPWVGLDVTTPGLVVLGLAEETEDEIHRRLHAAAKCMRLSDEQVDLAIQNIIAMPLAGKDVSLLRCDGGNVAVSTIADRLHEHLRGLGRDIALIVLDPLSRWGGSDVEKDNYAATRFVETAEALTELPGMPTVWIAHHKNKGGRDRKEGNVSDARGATAITDGGRWALNIEEDTDTTVKISHSKSNYALKIEPIIAVRDRTHSGALRLMTDAEAAEYDASDDKTSGNRGISDADIDAAIIAALREHGPQTSQAAVFQWVGGKSDRRKARLRHLISDPDSPVTYDAGKYRLCDDDPESGRGV